MLVGSGPQATELERLYPDALFTGPKHGEDLAKAYASADVFVFPSLTDTFGLVLLEALASGVPVAAFPTSGPKDMLSDPACGALGDDLKAMAIQALEFDREAARAHALRYSWENSAREFVGNILEAHNLGLPKKRTRFRRSRGKRTPNKENSPVGGNRAVSILILQFGGRVGGQCVHPQMVRALLLFKGM